jgi:uncharacterized protein YggE
MRLALLICVCATTAAFGADGLPNQPYLYVEGTGGAEKPADVVTIKFDVVARQSDQLKANQEVQAKAAKIFGLLKEKRIPDHDVIAQSISAAPQYEDNDNKRGKIIHAVERSFAVELGDVTIFPQLVDELLTIPGVEFTAIEIDLANRKEAEDEVSAKAVADAQAKARATAEMLDMKIDSVFAVSPVPIPEIPNRMVPRSERVVVTGSFIPTSDERIGGSRFKLAPVTVSKSVHVIYLISPSK